MAAEMKRGVVALIVIIGAVLVYEASGNDKEKSSPSPGSGSIPAVGDTSASNPARPTPKSQPVVDDDLPIAPVETDAVIFDSLKGKIKMMNAAVSLVRGFTYRCDSVSAFRPFVFSPGFTIVCNRFRYTYSIEDKGGHWIVTVE